jgi:flagellar biosynthesis/type III secretory pathway chaperone
VQEKWEKLTAVFMEMLVVYQEILKSSYQKREVLVQSNVNELKKIMKQEETLFYQVTKLDKTSKSIIKEIAVIYGLTERESTLPQLVSIADEDMVCDFKKIEQELYNVIRKITEVNVVNKKLVEQGLMIVNYSLNLLAQSSVGPTYHPNEKASFVSPNKALFDSKA